MVEYVNAPSRKACQGAVKGIPTRATRKGRGLGYAQKLIQLTTRTYKRRWSVETGFRELNAFHPQLRCRTHVQKWADLFTRGWAYDLWQFWTWQRARRGYLPASRTRQIFQGEAAFVLRELLFEIVQNRVKSCDD
ncbi:MAG: hypothetical protein RBG13Loki_2060 [Promethearchaeota archaeon CR_4]|nr:MAG: hypothetical protein RBG13Loki_2060 [Candidatus Lokiarchaeota archaeon CR_4]